MNEHKWRRGILLVVLILAALAVSGCSGGRAAALAGSSWPGITVADDVVYVAYQTGVFALDLDSRSEIWRYSALSNRRSLIGGRSPVQFYAEPAFDDDIVVVGDYTETLHAINAESGEEEWTFSTAQPRSIFGQTIGTRGARFIGGAVIGEGIVYAGAVDGNLYALDAESGKERWDFPTGGEIWDAPLLFEGMLYVPSLDHHLYAVNAEDGSERWRFEADGALVGTPTLDDGVLYFGAFDKTVYALDAESGRELWTRQVNDWVWDSPAVADGTLVVGDLSGHVYGLHSDDGTIAWELQTEDEGPVVGTSLIQDGIAYFGSGDANVYAVDVESGQQRWRTLVRTEITGRILGFTTSTSMRDVPIYGPVVPLKDKLLVGLQQGDNLLQVLEADSGSPTWTFAAEGSASPVASAQDEEEPEEVTPQQQLMRWLPLVISMTLFTILLMRRRQPE